MDVFVSDKKLLGKLSEITAGQVKNYSTLFGTSCTVLLQNLSKTLQAVSLFSQLVELFHKNSLEFPKTLRNFFRYCEMKNC